MSNKPLLQQFKNIITSLSNENTQRLFQIFQILSSISIEQKIRVVSYKCYETTYIYQGKKINGYGRSEAESVGNSLKNLMEILIEDEKNFSSLKQALKLLNEESGKAPNPKNTNSIQIINEIGSKSSGSSNQYLNSSANGFPNPNTSFDIKDLENKKNVNMNISFVKPSSNKIEYSSNQCEMEDIFKMNENKGDNKMDSSFADTSNNVYKKSSYVPNMSMHQKKPSRNDMSLNIEMNNKMNPESFCCSHEEELHKAKQKIDLLTKKMKLVMEENKILKSLLEDEEKKAHNYSSVNVYGTLSNMNTNLNTKKLTINFQEEDENALKQSCNKAQVNKPPINNYHMNNLKDLTNKENFLSVEKNGFMEKARSISVDLNIKDNPQNAAAALNNLNAAQKSKKPVPRLRLEEIPTFHGHNKSNKPMTQYQIPLKSNHDSDEND